MDGPITAAPEPVPAVSSPIAINPSIVDRVARTIVRRHRLPFQDVDDVRSALWLKLLDRDGRVVRRFGGRGSLFAYLMRVARRVVLDQQIATLGRWRPARGTRRLGGVAIEWARLVERDGLSTAEATALLQSRGRAPAAIDAVTRLRPRAGRRGPRRFVSLDTDDRPQSRPRAAGRPIDRLDVQECRRAVIVAIRSTLGQLTPEERRLLRRRFADGLRISDIARRDGYRPMRLYREYARILDRMRQLLAAAGVDARTVATASEEQAVGASTLDLTEPVYFGVSKENQP